MKKSILFVLITLAALSGFAKDAKKAVKFSSTSVSSSIKCEKLAKKAFEENYRKITSIDNLTIWYKDADNYIYFYESGVRGENRSVEGHALIDGHTECYSAFISRFEGENSEEVISLGTKDKNVSMSERLEKALTYTTNMDFPSKKEWKEKLIAQRTRFHENIDGKVIPGIQ